MNRRFYIAISFAMSAFWTLAADGQDGPAPRVEPAAQTSSITDDTAAGARAVGFIVTKPDGAFPLPRIVLQHDAASGTGIDWSKLKDLTYMQLTTSTMPIHNTVRYLREAVQRM